MGIGHSTRKLNIRNSALLLGVSGLVLLGTFLTPVISSASGSSSPQADNIPSADPLNVVASQVQALASQSYSLVFGGMIETNSSTHLDVYLTTLDPNIETAFSQLATPGTISFIQTRSALSQLLSLEQQLVSQRTDLANEGILIEEVYPDVATGLLAVGVQGLTPAITSSLANIVGAGNVETFEVGSSSPFTLTSTRINDSTPWKGGDSITNASYYGCTSGVPVNLGSTSYTVEAGHCFSPSASIYNRLNTGSGSNALMGSGYSQDLSGGGTDTGILNVRSSTNIWTGPIGSPSLSYLAGYTNEVLGSYVCNDGSYSGEVCGLYVNQINVCIYVGSPRTGSGMECQLDHAIIQDHSSLANQEGDSGAPVLQTSGSSLEAVGVVSASTTADTATCVYNVTICYWDVYYTQMSATLAEYHATIN